MKGTLEDSLPGWTPWEFISFDEKAMEHEAEIQIKVRKIPRMTLSGYIHVDSTMHRNQDEHMASQQTCSC